MERQTSSLADRLAAFAVALTPEAIPPSVREDACWRLLDTIGVAVAGAGLDSSQAVLAVAEAQAGRPEAGVLTRRSRLPVGLAAFVNAAFAHAADYDDTHSVAMVHMSSVAVSTALAVGERTGSGGKQLLLAQVAGAEVGLRIAAAAPHLFHARNYHATGVVGPFAAAVVAGRLLRLGDRELAHALGLAGSQAAGLRQGNLDGSWVKRLHPAWAAQSGVTSALLAGRGFTGPAEVLEGRFGLYATLLHGAGPEAVAPDSVLAGLGEDWIYPESTFKPYPNGAWNHSAMEGVARIMREANLQADDIERIDCSLPEACLPIVCEPRELRLHPATPYHMKFSLPISVAMLAINGRVRVSDYSEGVRRDRRLSDFASRVHCAADPGLAPRGFPARVRLRSRDGREFAADVPAQRGGPGNPMTPDEHRAKFRDNVEPVLGTAASERLLAALEDAWDEPDCSNFVRLAAAAA